MKKICAVIFLMLILGAGAFGIGFGLGLFLFPDCETRNCGQAKASSEEIKPLAAAQTLANQTVSSSQAEPIKEKSFCSDETKFSDETDSKFCSIKQKTDAERSLEINLTAKKAALYEKGKLAEVLNLAYQSPEGTWFEAPTGYFSVGEKKEEFLSSLFPVVMPFSLQYYEDFFIHGIPYYENGEPVVSNFTGGCLRFQNIDAEQIFDFMKTGDAIAVYKTFDDLKIKDGFSPPVELENSWIRQRFNNPLRNSRVFGGLIDYIKYDYYQHTGLDFAPYSTSSDKLSVFAIYGGVVAKIQKMDKNNDHGFGNAIILEHQINGEKIYSLYGHLSSIKEGLKKSDAVLKGEIIGEIGNSGYGCENYWKIGNDGCTEKGKDDTHLHFEIKKSGILGNPEGGLACENPGADWRICYGYTPDNPEKYGYLDPVKFLFEQKPL